MTVASPAIIEGFTLQADWCERMDSPLYGTLLTAARDDIASGGVTSGIVADFPGDPVSAALALRFMGGVHRLVLMGLAPRLARHYPSVGGSPDDAHVVDDFLATVAEHPGYLTDALAIAPQTNEVGRSAMLLPGLLAAVDDGSDVRLLEIGASGGLNLFGTEFFYDFDSWTWGDAASPVRVTGEWRGDVPLSKGRINVVERRGCDVMPLPVTDDQMQLRLLSFIWPDQPERFARIRGAIDIALTDPPVIDEADAGAWLESQLAVDVPRNTVTVVQHSLMWQYLPDETKQRAEAAIAEAGERATRRRPFAHVSFEPAPDWNDGGGFVITVTRWPGGDSVVVGRAHAHGVWVEWGSG